MESENLTHTVFKNIQIIDIAEQGCGVGKSDGLVFFVERAVPGDIVDVAVRKKKRNHVNGFIVHTNHASTDRATPFCKYFYTCGGCKWQHINYATQLKFKQKSVCDALERIGKIDVSICEPILPSKAERYYRNKLEYTFSNRAWLTDLSQKNENKSKQALGFHVPGRFDKILDIEECYLQIEISNQIRNAVREFAIQNEYTFYDIKNHTGELRNLIVRTTSLGEIMVAVVFAYTTETRIQMLMDFLKNQFSQINSLLYVVNQKKNDTLFDQKIQVHSGSEYIFEGMPRADSQKTILKFRIGLKSFYQTNSDQAYELYKIIFDFAQFNGNELVYDLYTGAGTIANFIANNVQSVVGIDCVGDAIQDAVLNSKFNDITNTTFYAGDIKDTLNETFVREHGKPDLIITDPPRAGMHPDVVKCLLNIEADKIIYVSCNPASQARDLLLLTEKYQVQRIKPVDMFPHTQHVENVILLKLKNGG